MLGSDRPTYFAHPNRAYALLRDFAFQAGARIPGKANKGGPLQTNKGTNVKSGATRLLILFF